MTKNERAIFARLRRLRREEPAAPDERHDAADPHAPDSEPNRGDRRPLPPGVPTWLRERLERGGGATGRGPRRPSSFEDAPAPSPPRAPTTVGDPDALVELEGPRGAHAARVDLRPVSAKHGAYALESALSLDAEAFASLARDGSLDAVDLSRAVYLDIETTGLSGGAGTYPFLVALGRFVDARFEVWQGFLRDPSDEDAMLAAAAERIADAGAIVSFFGKSFDRHRLEDKMRLFGVEPPFEGRPHLDLYHPFARLYAPALPDGKLQTMERELCGVTREDDLPGAFAPEAWFDYLAERPHRLEAVFQHNLDDVLSLVTLAAHLGRTFGERDPEGRPLSGPPGHRAWGLARILADRGEHDAAVTWADRALDRLDGELRTVRALRARSLRRLGEHATANAACVELSEREDDPHAIEALIDLAKDAEHARRDPAEALAFALRAARALPDACVGPTYERFARDLSKRVERLRKKTGAVEG